ncbi:MAG: DUF4124 domain-containing protein [Burkholderiales bacterium]|jgi:hypothetical protein|nr:DUF4124 domain-containing protein [Nitrosomonadaceae bacterium]
MLRSPIRVFFALAVLLATATVAAQVYRWVDKDGKVHFSDQPPPNDAKGVTAKKVDARPASGSVATPPPSPAAAKDGKVDPKAPPKDAKPESQKTLAEKAKDFEKRREDDAKAAKKAEEQAKVDRSNQERCTQAQRYLRDLESGRPIATSNAKGERELMDDAARTAEMNRARAAVSESCK